MKRVHSRETGRPVSIAGYDSAIPDSLTEEYAPVRSRSSLSTVEVGRFSACSSAGKSECAHVMSLEMFNDANESMQYD